MKTQLHERLNNEAPFIAPDVDPGSGRDDAQESSACSTETDALCRDLAQDWLIWQCEMIAGIIRGAVFVPADEGQVSASIAQWPGVLSDVPQLTSVAQQALSQRLGVVKSRERYGQGGGRICDLVACPLLLDEEPVAVVAVMMAVRSEPQQGAVLQLLQWGLRSMETMLRQRAAVRRERSASMLDLMAATLGHVPLHASALEVANTLANQLGCERVSVGIRRGLQIRLEALSHTTHFDPRTQLVRGVEAAMEEAVDQRASVVHSAAPQSDPIVSRAHAELAARQANGAVCSIPLPGRDGAVGAITLERNADRAFDADTVHLCEAIAELVGPILDLKRRDERPLFAKVVEGLRVGAAQVLGPGHVKLKLFLSAVFGLVALLSVAEGEYRVTAPSTLEGSVQHAVVAPQEGYVAEASVQAGDIVNKGDLLASLDDRQLRLEHRKWQSEREKHVKEYHDALAKHDRVQLGLLRARIDQTEAELRLLNEKIARSRLRAPFDGVVVSGDLSQSLGAPVVVGQVLFEVAPLDDYRVALEVDEHDVAELQPGQSGHLRIAAVPNVPFAMTLQKITPATVAGEGRNYFRVEASLDRPAPVLRPGMHGVAKLDVGRRKLLWIWTHAVVDRLGLWAWSLGF